MESGSITVPLHLRIAAWHDDQMRSGSATRLDIGQIKTVLVPRQALLQKLDPSRELTVPAVSIRLEPRVRTCIIFFWSNDRFPRNDPLPHPSRQVTGSSQGRTASQRSTGRRGGKPSPSHRPQATRFAPPLFLISSKFRLFFGSAQPSPHPLRSNS